MEERLARRRRGRPGRGRRRDGVKAYDEAGQHWVVLQDPEGNEFCLH